MYIDLSTSLIFSKAFSFAYQGNFKLFCQAFKALLTYFIRTTPCILCSSQTGLSSGPYLLLTLSLCSHWSLCLKCPPFHLLFTHQHATLPLEVNSYANTSKKLSSSSS